MMIRESTLSQRSAMPLLSLTHPVRALELEGLGDDANGEDTGLSCASSATMGAAPVPVPPPIPAVMKTMSVPSRALRNGSPGTPRRTS